MQSFPNLSINQSKSARRKNCCLRVNFPVKPSLMRYLSIIQINLNNPNNILFRLVEIRFSAFQTMWI